MEYPGDFLPTPQELLPLPCTLQCALLGLAVSGAESSCSLSTVLSPTGNGIIGSSPTAAPLVKQPGVQSQGFPCNSPCS